MSSYETTKDRVRRLVDDLNDEITFLDGCLNDTYAKTKEAQEEREKIRAYIQKLYKEIDEYRSQRDDALCMKMALLKYAESLI